MRTCPVCIVAAASLIGLAGVALMGGAGPAAVTTPAASVAAEPFAVDAMHSSVMFRIKHLNVSYFYGRFNKVAGSFKIDGDATELDVTVDADSVDSNSADRDKHIKSQDFFSVKEFPSITFKSKSAKKIDGDKIEVTGDLTFRGVTKSVTVKVTPTGEGPGMRGGTVAGIETTLVINRSEFGMNYMPKGLGEDVTLYIALEGSRK
jgi:polyisoprenoid-binding protein YceI